MTTAPIVKPDATPEEVRAVVEDDQGGQIFSQAVSSVDVLLCMGMFWTRYQLMSSNRYGESRAAYREVQERHEDIKRIERTIAELAQLFNDVCSFALIGGSLVWSSSYHQMSIMVEQQDETINIIEAQAGEVEKDVETGWDRCL
jgi:syntaxin 1B/2/3